MHPLLSLAAPLVVTVTLLAAGALSGNVVGSETYQALSPIWRQLATAWVTVATALLAASLWKGMTRQSWGNAVRLRGVRPTALLTGLLAGGALWMVVQGIAALQHSLLPQALAERWDLELQQRTLGALVLLNWGTPVQLAGALLAGAAAPAFAEELTCRGLLVESALRSDVPRGAVVVASALLFAVVHFSLPMLLPMTALGVGLGLLSLRAGSVLPAVAAHFAFNTVSILLLPNVRGATPESSPALLLLSLLALGLFLLLLRTVAPRQSSVEGSGGGNMAAR